MVCRFAPRTGSLSVPRFVVLEHDSPRGLHWDFMLEKGSSLATWALPREPAAGRPIHAEALPDHRLEYLDYEGPISGNRGTVRRWDAGEYRMQRQSEAEWVVWLTGGKLSGRAVLRRIDDAATKWEFSYCLKL
jgi:hypothetical protein